MSGKIITDDVLKKQTEGILQLLADNTYNFVEYTEEEIGSVFELSPEEQKSLSAVINDNVVSKNKVHSSEYTHNLLNELEGRCNQYTVEQIANSNILTRKIVTTQDQITDSNIIYMILTDSTNNIYTQYMLIDEVIKSLGTTTIDLSDYLLVSDFNTQINDYAKKTEVVSQSDVVNDLTTVSSSTVLNTQALKELLDEINNRLTALGG